MKEQKTGFMLVLALCAHISGCANVQNTGAGNAAKNTFASDDPCSNNSRNQGLAVGALTGAAVGYALGNRKPAAVALASAAGMIVGGSIGSDMDNKRCKLSKIARQFDLKIDVAGIDLNGTVIDSDQTNQARMDPNKSIGLAVSLGEKNGRGHFESASDQLTPQAKAYFAAIADTYNPELFAAHISDLKERAAYLSAAKNKKILLIGHTDDVGDSLHNANLSERRALVVAKFLVSQGIPENSVYFQGAGEQFPKADNRTEAGRQENRRVELVEIMNEVNFKKYLGARSPKLEFYRTTSKSVGATKNSQGAHTTGSEKFAAAPSSAPKGAEKLSRATNEPKNPSAIVGAGKAYDFGGHPLLTTTGEVSLGSAVRDDGGFSLFSKAYADDDTVVLVSCDRDRPRASGDVKSFKTGKTYTTTDYLPGLYNTSWHATLNGHLIMLNHVGILSGSAAASNPPEMKIYANYNSQKNRTAKPDVQITPSVNTYRGSKGVLYRVFAGGGAGGVKCMDVLLPLQGGLEAKSGQLIYGESRNLYSVDYKPKMVR